MIELLNENRGGSGVRGSVAEKWSEKDAKQNVLALSLGWIDGF